MKESYLGWSIGIDLGLENVLLREVLGLIISGVNLDELI